MTIPLPSLPFLCSSSVSSSSHSLLLSTFAFLPLLIFFLLLLYYSQTRDNLPVHVSTVPLLFILFLLLSLLFLLLFFLLSSSALFAPSLHLHLPSHHPLLFIIPTLLLCSHSSSLTTPTVLGDVPLGTITVPLSPGFTIHSCCAFEREDVMEVHTYTPT